MKILILSTALLASCGQAPSNDSPAAAPTPNTDQTLAAEQGSVGPVGPAGSRGEIGPRGPAGADGKTITGNMWLDPVTNTYWLIGGTGTYADATKACGTTWKVPSYSELYTAYGRGLPLQTTTNINAKQYWWSSTTPIVTTPDPSKETMVITPAHPEQGVTKESDAMVNACFILCMAL